jgi:hypothetical protein
MKFTAFDERNLYAPYQPCLPTRPRMYATWPICCAASDVTRAIVSRIVSGSGADGGLDGDNFSMSESLIDSRNSWERARVALQYPASTSAPTGSKARTWSRELPPSEVVCGERPNFSYHFSSFQACSLPSKDEKVLSWTRDRWNEIQWGYFPVRLVDYEVAR